MNLYLYMYYLNAAHSTYIIASIKVFLENIFVRTSSVKFVCLMCTIIFQECLWLNSILCHIRQQTSDLQQNLMGGPEALPQTHLATVIALQEEHVPVSWVHPNSLPCTHSLMSFLDGENILNRPTLVKSHPHEHQYHCSSA